MGAWIEIETAGSACFGWMSHPTMGAWIEILNLMEKVEQQKKVAPHDGCVD